MQKLLPPFLLCSLVFVLLAPSRVEAKPKQKPFPYKILAEHHGEVITVSIGLCPSVAKGNRASLSALAHIIKRYPKGLLYYVNWKVRTQGVVSHVETQYSREEWNVIRASYIPDRVGVKLPELHYVSVSPQKLVRIGETGGGFEALGENVFKSQ